jgi:hypothetical protein
VRYVIVAAIAALLLVPPALAAKPRPPHYSMWMCIHSKEASWTDSGDPYYGGLQMGWWFMRTYASRLLAVKGPAHRWTPMEQMWVAENAYRREGYSLRWLRGQWPNTSYGCV